MPSNILIADEVVEALSGERVCLEAPPEAKQALMGRAILQDVEAVVNSAGVIIAFELDEDEVRAIQRGKNTFLVHFYSHSGIIPFRMIFERESFDINPGETKEADVLEFRLQVPQGDSKED